MIKSTTPSILRSDLSRSTEYLYEKPKQKGFFGKLFSFLGKVGGAVTGVIPGMQPLSLGLYGVSKLSGDMANASQAKEYARVAEANSEYAGKNITLEGYYDPMSAGQAQTNFMAPTEMNDGIYETVMNRESMRQDMLNNL
jgi:hypothetical protein